MPSASPFLDELLTRWTDQRSQIRREVDALLEQLTGNRQILEKRWSLRRTAQGKIIRLFEREAEAAEARADDRLRLIEEWKNRLVPVDEECRHIDAVLRATQFFERAPELSTRLSAILRNRASRLEERQTQTHDALEKWLNLLGDKEIELQALKQKETGYQRPFLVSRARKQPELTFVSEQNAAELVLSSNLQDLRQAVNRALGRIYKASRLLELHAQTNKDLFEQNQRQAQRDLKEPQERLFSLRDQVLGDALLYESCRRKLRSIQDRVRSIRCLEDVYKTPEPFWKKLLDWLSEPLKYR